MVSAVKGKTTMAAAAAVMALLLLLMAGAVRTAELANDDGTTTAAALEAAKATIGRAHAIDAPSWAEARRRLRVSTTHLSREPYIAYAWLVRASRGGRISYSSGGVGKQGDDLVQLAGVMGEAAKLSDTWTTGGPEKFVPLAVAAMSGDDERPEVLRYLAVPVRFADGDGAIVAVAYDRTPAAGSPGIAYMALLLGALGSLALCAYLLVSGWRSARNPRPPAGHEAGGAFTAPY